MSWRGLTKRPLSAEQDATELNFMIDVIMERHGIRAGLTAKQGSKRPCSRWQNKT
ncbi:MAG: hypothetical protein M5U34_36575 [Chloroflexi bacterium]|nr:hypothetical protein [Chloroflexota bacterium]